MYMMILYEILQIVNDMKDLDSEAFHIGNIFHLLLFCVKAQIISMKLANKL